MATYIALSYALPSMEGALQIANISLGLKKTEYERVDQQLFQLGEKHSTEEIKSLAKTPEGRPVFRDVKSIHSNPQYQFLNRLSFLLKQDITRLHARVEALSKIVDGQKGGLGKSITSLFGPSPISRGQ